MRELAMVVCFLCGPAFAALEDSFSPAERSLLEEVDQQHFIKARVAAEKILESNPHSFAAVWAMARVHHDEEGNHARALAWIRKAQKHLGNGEPDWSMKLLLEEYSVLAEMNRNPEALEVLDRYEALYGPPPSYLRVWPLFKSGRVAEARALALRLSTSSDEIDRAEGYNGLLSIAFEEHDREGTYEWALKGVTATQGKSCTILRNAASAAFNRLKLDEAEELSVRAQKVKDCIDPVENQLAGLAIVTGQFQQAVAALESSRSAFIEKRYRPHFALERRAVLVDLLEAVGQNEEAVKLAAELYGQQQRMGVSSSAPEIERLSRTRRYAFALDGRIAQLKEQASYAELFGAKATFMPELTRLLSKRWEVRRALVALLAGGERLLLMTRPAMGEVADWATWRTGDLIDVVGSGIMRSSLAAARAADAHIPEATPAFDALEGELAFRSGDLERAVLLSTKVLEQLTKREALLRWRTQAWRADALRRLGRIKEARVEYQEVLQRWPTAFRILGLEIPITLAHDNSAQASEAADRIKRSARFDVVGSAPFRVTAESRGATVELCLLDDNGAQLACASGDNVNAALTAFHTAAFSPKVSLTQSDLKSLDGSPVRVGADQALKQLLNP